MSKKTGGGPEGRIDEDPWQPPGAEEPIQRSLDLALQYEGDEETEDELEFIYGDIVHDTEADDPSDLVVVNIPGFEIDQWEVEEGVTLADTVKGYPDDDYVILVVPPEILEEHRPDWDTRDTPLSPSKLVEDGVSLESFPSLQLVRVQNSHLRE